VGSVGVLLVLAAFANGCSALTGVEAIANATPAFQRPRQVRARHAEAALGLILGLLLIGLAVVVQQFNVLPVQGRSLLSLVTEASLGTGWPYLTVQLATMLLLALAANTTFGGLPVLAARLASDGFLPHLFALRADRLVHRYGVVVLAVLAGALLLFSGGRIDVLVPLFAVGVFIGFFLCQIGMVSHWHQQHGPTWRTRASINALGAVLTAVAALVITVTKFTHGAWLIMLTIPLLVALFSRVHAAYDRIGCPTRRGQPARPAPPGVLHRRGPRGRDHPVNLGVAVCCPGHGPGGGRGARHLSRRNARGQGHGRRLDHLAARGAVGAAGITAPRTRTPTSALRPPAACRPSLGTHRRSAAATPVGTAAQKPTRRGRGAAPVPHHQRRGLPLPDAPAPRCHQCANA
jgi:hypothetical protein